MAAVTETAAKGRRAASDQRTSGYGAQGSLVASLHTRVESGSPVSDD